MLVRRLEIQGFKSFAERLVLEFGPGATGIVGPNGAGKSNVTDAIRWALGEQNPRYLRSTRMEDLIFGGSGTRKALGFAEVTLTLDNEDGRLPLDYSEISLTRRLYRSGESEYLLNGSPARLRDITELLSGTGLGREGYSLIGQGRIDEILMSTPESRRGLFDEACGIGLHRGRKKEALARLEDVASRLERVSDVTTELDAQRDPLAKQATVARAFVAYRDELERLELWLESQGLARLRARSTSAGARLAEARHKAAVLRERLARLEDEARTLRAAQGELGNLLERKQQEAALSEAALRQLVSKIQGLERVMAERERESQLLREEQGRLAERVERAGTRRAELEAERKARSERLSGVRSELTLGSEAEALARAAVAGLKEAVEEAKSELLEVMSQVSATRFELSSAEAEGGRLRAEEARLVLETESAKAEMARLTADLGAAAARLGEVGPETEACREALGDLEVREAALGASLADLGRAAERERAVVAEFEGEKASLEAAGAAASRWARSALVAVTAATDLTGGEPSAWAGGLVGVLGEELTIDPAERLALEVALGRYAGALIVRNEDNVRSYMRHFKAEGLGPAVVMPLDLVTEHVRRHGSPRASGFICLADRVSCGVELRPVVELLLGGTALAPDFGQARRVVDDGLARKAVTPDGLLVRAAGVVSVAGEGGSSPAKGDVQGGESLERLRRLKEVRAELAGRRERLGTLATEREKTELDLAAARVGRSRLATRHQELALERASLAGKLESLRRREETLGQKGEAAGLDLPGLGQRILGLEVKAKEAAERLREFGSREAGVRQELGRKEAEARAAEESLAAGGRRVSESRVQVATFEERDRSGAAEAGRLKDDLERLSAEAERLENRLARLAEEREAARDETAPLREKLAAASAAAGAQPGEDIESWRRRRTEVAGALEAKEGGLVGTRTELDELGERERREEMRLTRLEAEEDMTLRRLRRDWGDEWEEKAARAAETLGVDRPAEAVGIERSTDVPPAADSEEDLAAGPGGSPVPAPRREVAAQARVDELRKALSGLGVVNIGAIEEHRRLTERAEFLKSQATDLGEARESLLRLVSEMDETMAQKFEEGFLAVRRAFREKIPGLFGGGHGDLILTDRDHLLDSGIEIVIEPPAKRLQNLALLSAGERALAALALMLSFLDVRPSPFVVLDEIDAPLDDANVARFGAAVRDLVGQGRTQFILVTHNKATMEVAESLYGVTMGEDGVSRLVSVKLEERDEFERRLAKEAV